MRAHRSVRMLVAAALLVSPLAPLRGAVARPLQPAGPNALPRLTPARHDGLTRALANGSITQAQYALERALSLFHPGLVEARFGRVETPDPHDATMILRDLRIRKDALSGSELRQANSLFARPNDNHNDGPGAVKWTNAARATATLYCSTNVCIHWVTISNDAPPLDDVAPADGVPDWVATTDAALEHVWTEEVTNRGYRAPESDATSNDNGSDGKLDIYLADLRPDGLFGYTTSDDPKSPPPYDVSAYMVLDNDYVGYGYSDPTAPLDVTAAHEFFHAVQFAYDAYEDRWMMEATAVWMEDEVYDNINDNYGYLSYGPLGVPGVPLDKGGSGLHQYGAWTSSATSGTRPTGPGVAPTTTRRRRSPGRSRSTGRPSGTCSPRSRSGRPPPRSSSRRAPTTRPRDWRRPGRSGLPTRASRGRRSRSTTWPTRMQRSCPGPGSRATRG